jgi:hypothetical protein
LHLKAAKLQRLRHKNANTENKYRPGLLLLFFSRLVNFLNIYYYSSILDSSGKNWDDKKGGTGMTRKGSIGMTGKRSICMTPSW